MTGEININRIEVGQNMNKITGEKSLEATQDHINILEDRIVQNTGIIIGTIIIGNNLPSFSHSVPILLLV